MMFSTTFVTNTHGNLPGGCTIPHVFSTLRAGNTGNSRLAVNRVGSRGCEDPFARPTRGVPTRQVNILDGVEGTAGCNIVGSAHGQYFWSSISVAECKTTIKTRPLCGSDWSLEHRACFVLQISTE